MLIPCRSTSRSAYVNMTSTFTVLTNIHDVETSVTRETIPVHTTAPHTKVHTEVSNYTSGSVTVFQVRPDRSLGPPCCFRQHEPYGPDQVLPGPVKERQEGPHAHQARLMEERPSCASGSNCSNVVPLPCTRYIILI